MRLFIQEDEISIRFDFSFVNERAKEVSTPVDGSIDDDDTAVA